MLTRRDLFLWTAATILAVACSGDASRNGERYSTVRDSAGITIIYNEESTTPGLRFGAEPVLDIGAGGARSEAEFFRIAGAVVLSDGRIVVADGGSGELRFFGSDGVFLERVGGLGGGPGEFEQLEFLARLADDTIFAYDGSKKEATWFDREGRLARTASLSTVVRTSTDIAGVLADGSILLVDHGSMYSRNPAENEAGQRVRDTVTVLRIAAAAEEADTVALLQCGTGSVERLSAMGVSQLFVAPMHLTATPLVSNIGDQVLVGYCVEYELQFFDGATGALQRIVRREWTPVPAAVDDVAQVLQAYNDMVGDGPNPFAQLTLDVLENVPAMEFLPPYAGLPARAVIDSEGNLWVPAFAPLPSEFVFGEAPLVVTPSWDVFDSDGHMLGRVEAPAAFRLTDLSKGLAIGVTTDEDGVEAVLVYQLSR